MSADNIPFRVSRKVLKQDDGWETSDAPHARIFFFRGGSFDVVVYQRDHDEGGIHYPKAWHMSCHRQFGFSKFLIEAKDERTAKLLALKEIMDRCRAGAHRAAKAIKEVADAHHKLNTTLPPLSKMPFGIPSDVPCEQCKSTPTIPLTKLCGPCTFGDPSTAGGNW